MRHPVIVAVAGAALIATACSGGASPNPASTDAPASATTSVAASPSPRSSSAPSTTAAGSPLSPGDAVDVTGIVGTITTDPRAIEITRISGADVRRIEVPQAADIRSAGGSRIDFSAIKTSDRIIAEGRISDRGDALVASQVTVSAVVPGAQPGG